MTLTNTFSWFLARFASGVFEINDATQKHKTTIKNKIKALGHPNWLFG